MDVIPSVKFIFWILKRDYQKIILIKLCIEVSVEDEDLHRDISEVEYNTIVSVSWMITF